MLKRRATILRLFELAIIASSCASSLDTRFETAMLHGIVLDTEGHSIDNARILIDGIEVATSSKGGKFHVPEAPWGHFEILAAAKDYEDARAEIDFIDPSLMLVIRLEGTMSIAKRCAESLARGETIIARRLLERLSAFTPESIEAAYLEILVLNAEGSGEASLKAFDTLAAKYPASTEIAVLGARMRGTKPPDAADR